jgi:AraC-like DNA-binding protein
MQLPPPDLLVVNSKNIENDFYISLKYNDLPIAYSPCRINQCLVCICLSGCAEIEVDLRSFHFETNDIIVVFPGQILACNEKSADFSLLYFSFSNQLIDDILYRFPTSFIEFLRETVKYHLPETEKEKMIVEYISMLHRKFCETKNVCRSEIILNLLHNFYLDLYNNVIISNELSFSQRKRKKEVQEEFFRLVKTNTTIREVAFYAGKLCITPKYLSIIMKECTGTSAKELIDKFAITELKLQLKSSSAQLKEIAAQLNYPCEAFLCKFFKKHTGITPSQYRNTSR